MTTTSPPNSTLALLDTNVLVYALNTSAEQHLASKTLLSQASAAKGFCIAPQNLVEFHAIVTDPRRVPNPVSSATAVDAMRGLLRMAGLALLTVPLDISDRWTDLVGRYSITRQHAFDAYLVATMLGNGVKRIYTFNAAHFQAFEEIEALVSTPAKPAQTLSAIASTSLASPTLAPQRNLQRFFARLQRLSWTGARSARTLISHAFASETGGTTACPS